MPFHEAPWCEEKTTSLEYLDKKIQYKNQILLQDCESFLLGSSLRLRHGHTQRNAAASLLLTSCQCRTIFVTFFRVPHFTVQKYLTISVLHPIFLAACSLKGGSCHLCLLNCCAAAARTPKRRCKFQHSFTIHVCVPEIPSPQRAMPPFWRV